jgi:hypothetical protein
MGQPRVPAAAAGVSLLPTWARVMISPPGDSRQIGSIGSSWRSCTEARICCFVRRGRRMSSTT